MVTKSTLKQTTHIPDMKTIKYRLTFIRPAHWGHYNLSETTNVPTKVILLLA